MSALALLILLSLAPAWAGAAQVVGEAEVHRAITAFVHQQLRDQVDDDTRVEVFPRWQGPLQLEGKGAVEIGVRRLSSRPFRGPVVIRLEIKVEGQTLRSMNSTVDTRYYRQVLVAARGLRRGEVAEEAMFDWAERDITDQKSGYYTFFEQLAGTRTRRPMSLGQILTPGHVEKLPLVHRGDEVDLQLKTEHMVISARGQALQDGGDGVTIRVRNLDSGRVVRARVVDHQTVAIRVPR